MSRVAELLVLRARPFGAASADALAVLEGRVVTGLGRELTPLRGPGTRVVDAAGATVTPGLADAHLHLVSWARSLAELTLDPAWSCARVLEAVSAYAAARPVAGVLVGRGWASDRWEAAPDRAMLDAVCADRPLLLHCKDFHALWVNTAALTAAGIDAAAPDPDGGRFERDATGRLTGVAREHAVRAFTPLLPGADAAQEREWVAAAVRRLHAEGITAVHDFEGAAEARLLRTVCTHDGETPLRLLLHVPHDRLETALSEGVESGRGDSWLRGGAVKLFADGTLSSRTAAMIEPYAGSADRGMELIPPDELAAIVRRAVGRGMSVAVHAIGDRAVRHTLDAFATVPPAQIAALVLPPRIEHAQLVHPADLPRFAALGVAASMQPLHCVADERLARERWTPWLDHSYPWAALARTGAALAFGSDAPVESPSVALGLHAALTRREPGAAASTAYATHQCLDLDAALTAYTRTPAELAGETTLGRFDRGAGGDLVIWDRDLFAATPDEVALARPVMTVIGGRVVHERASWVEAA